MTTPSQQDQNGHIPSTNGQHPAAVPAEPGRSLDYQLGYLAGQYETLARFTTINLDALAQLGERCHRPRSEKAPREGAPA